MSITFVGAAFDTPDAANIAEFWSAVLGRPVNAGATADHAAIDATSPDLGPRLTFHRVPEAKSVKNRFHPDLMSTDFDADIERLTGLGATVLNEVSAGSARWTTLADPDGNEFDLIAG
jgi:predicted enzyme related to lactoylglutathione lyase